MLVLGGDSERQRRKTAGDQLVLKTSKYSVHIISPQTTTTTIISNCRQPPILVPSLRMHMVLFLSSFIHYPATTWGQVLGEWVEILVHSWFLPSRRLYPTGGDRYWPHYHTYQYHTAIVTGQHRGTGCYGNLKRRLCLRKVSGASSEDLMLTWRMRSSMWEKGRWFQAERRLQQGSVAGARCEHEGQRKRREW